MAKKTEPVFTDKHEEKLEKMKDSMVLHTAFSATVGQKLEEISRVMFEIHGKLDQSLLTNAEKFTRLEGKDALYEERFKQLKEQSKSRDTNWWMIFSAVITIACTVLGAILVSK